MVQKRVTSLPKKVRQAKGKRNLNGTSVTSFFYSTHIAHMHKAFHMRVIGARARHAHICVKTGKNQSPVTFRFKTPFWDVPSTPNFGAFWGVEGF